MPWPWKRRPERHLPAPGTSKARRRPPTGLGLRPTALGDRVPGPRRAPTGLGHRDPALGTWGGIDDAHTPPPRLRGL